MTTVRSAFSLLELILVLVVLGLLSAVVASRLGGMRTTQGLDLAVEQLMEQVARGQRLAAIRSAVARLHVDVATLVTTVQLVDASGTTFSDPADGLQPDITLYDGAETITVSFTGDSGTATSSGTVDMLFYPDRRCDPAGTFSLVCRDRTTLVHCPINGTPPVRQDGVQQ